jgi:hypothetical protein
MSIDNSQDSMNESMLASLQTGSGSNMNGLSSSTDSSTSSSSSDDDDDFSLPSEDEDADYVDYVEISMPGRQSFSIPCTVPDGGDAQGHGHSTNIKQTRTRRASAEQQKAASGSYSHAGGDGDHEAYDENNACLLNLRISQCDMWCDLQNKRLWCILFHLLPLPLPLMCSSISACFALHF